MDVVALAQYDIRYAVASLVHQQPQNIFSTFIVQQIRLFVAMMVTALAEKRHGRAALPYLTDGRQLRFMFLPDGEDPDSLVRKEGKDAFEQRMKDAQTLSAFI